MNRRLIIVAVFGLGLGLAAQAFGQLALSATLKTGASFTDQDRGTVAKFVNAEVAKLSNKDPLVQTEAREALVNEVQQGNPSALFLDVYCQTLNDALLKLADNPQVRVRLNAAVVTARVADKADNIRLEPAAVKFLQDKSSPVVLWGVKSARSLMPVAMRVQANPARDPMLTQLVAAISDDLTGPVTQEAYEALSMGIFDDPKHRKDLAPQMLQAVVPEVQKLLGLRIALYRQGIPEDPETDTFAAKFLTDTTVWSGAPAQQARTVQLLADLLANASRRTADFAGKDGRDRKDQIVQMLTNVAKCAWVVGDLVKSEAIMNAALPVTKIDLSMDTKYIVGVCDDLITSAISAFPTVKKPAIPAGPAAGPAAATTAAPALAK